MPRQEIQFARRYRAALLDYLLHTDETGLSRAYDLGRRAMLGGFGLLAVLRTHQREVAEILEATHDADRSAHQLRAAQEFLMEALSPFEMTTRGYLDLLSQSDQRQPAAPVKNEAGS
jgi:two-component system sensor histidine kinase UhpB